MSANRKRRKRRQESRSQFRCSCGGKFEGSYDTVSDDVYLVCDKCGAGRSIDGEPTVDGTSVPWSEVERNDR